MKRPKTLLTAVLVLVSLLTLALSYNYVVFLVDAHRNFYSELLCVHDPESANGKPMQDYLKSILRERFNVVTWGQNVEVTRVIYGNDSEFIHIFYRHNGEDKTFASRYPWKSGPQKVYEAHLLRLDYYKAKEAHRNGR